MNQAKHFEAKMLKGYELTLDDKRQLKSLIDCLSYTDTHGMQWDRRKAVDRLINDQVGTTTRTASPTSRSSTSKSARRTPSSPSWSSSRRQARRSRSTRSTTACS